MIDVERFRQLPDSMEPPDVRRLFEELLDASESASIHDRENLVSAMKEVADRQYHTYEAVDDALRLRLNRWVQAHWDSESRNNTILMLRIISSVGLPDAFKLMCDALEAPDLRRDVREKIDQAIATFGDVGNPYADLQQTKNK